MQAPLIVPGAAPYLLPGGPTGCLLLHGFSSMPDEMRWLGDYLDAEGYTVLGQRLAGHATHPHDLVRTRWTDWLVSVEDGLAILGAVTERVFLIGLSLGGMVALTAAAHYPVAGVVGLSTPYYRVKPGRLRAARIVSLFKPLMPKKVVSADPPLHDRREEDYPAYPSLPTRSLIELDGLLAAMEIALPQVACPAYLIQSRDDAFVPANSMLEIYDRLGSKDKESLWLEGFEHALVRDPERQVVFDAVGAFVQRVAGGGPQGEASILDGDKE